MWLLKISPILVDSLLKVGPGKTKKNPGKVMEFSHKKGVWTLHIVYWWYWNDGRIFVLVCRNYIFKMPISCIRFCSFFEVMHHYQECNTTQKSFFDQWLSNCISKYQFHSFLAHLAKGKVSFCHHLVSVVC